VFGLTCTRTFARTRERERKKSEQQVLLVMDGRSDYLAGQ
jgi:hypothetical protein